MENEKDKKNPPLQRSVFAQLNYWVESSERSQTITTEEVCEQYGVPRYLVVREVHQQIEQAASCRSLPFTVLLVVSYACVAIGHMDAPTVRAVEHSVSFDIEDNANFAYDGDFSAHKGAFDVNSATDFWSFLNMGLVPLLYIHEKAYSEDILARNMTLEPGLAPTVALTQKMWGIMIYYNRIVGGIRFRQERAKNITCIKTPELNKFYGRTCVGESHDYSLEPDVDKARVTDPDDKYTRWLWVHEPTDQALKRVEDLEMEGWLDPFTEKVEISIPIYNAEYSTHSLMTVNFYFTRGGHIWKHIITQSCYATWFQSWYHYAADAIYLFCIFWIFCTEISDVASTYHSLGLYGLYSDYLSLWNFIDWLSVITGIILMVFFFLVVEQTRVVNEAGEKVGKIMRPVPQSRQDLPEVRNYVEQLEVAVNWVTFTQRSLARYPLIVVFRLFKAFHAQPRLALVTLTLKGSYEDLCHFLIVFWCVMQGFVTSAVVLFGREVSELSTVTRGVIFCTRLLLGDIEFDTMKEAGRMLAGLWIMVFMVLASLLLLNMLLAIVMDAYSEVKSGTGSSITLIAQIVTALRNWEGMHVPLTIVEKALEADMPPELREKLDAKDKKLKAKEYEDDDEEDEEEEEEDLKMIQEFGDYERKTIKIEDLQAICAKPLKDESVSSMLWGKKRKKSHAMTDIQAKEIIMETIKKYYEENEESADNFEFIGNCERINDRIVNIVNTHKKFNNREGPRPDEIEEDVSATADDEEEAGEADGEEHEGGDGDEEEPHPHEHEIAMHIDVREVMHRLHAEFMRFMEDLHADRSMAANEIARLTAEVEALRDRLTENVGAPGPWTNFLGDGSSTNLNGNNANPPAASAKPLGTASSVSRPQQQRSANPGTRLSRLDEEPVDEDQESVPDSVGDGGPKAPQASSDTMSGLILPDGFGGEPLKASQGMNTARAPEPLALDNMAASPSPATPAPATPAMSVAAERPFERTDQHRLTAERLAPMSRVPPGTPVGARPSYIALMQQQGLLPVDLPPSEHASSARDEEWPDEISSVGSSSHREKRPAAPVARRAGSSKASSEGRVSASLDGARRRGPGSDGIGSHLSDIDDSQFDLDESEAHDELSALEDLRSQDDLSEPDLDDWPTNGRSHNIRAGVGLASELAFDYQQRRSGGGAPPSGLGDVPKEGPPVRDYEFTNFRDAQSQLRLMLSKHRPGQPQGSTSRPMPVSTTSI